MNERNFNAMSLEAIDAFASVHGDEFHAHVSAGSVRYAVESGEAVIERRDFGFAVVTYHDKLPQLWLFYVSPERRGKGLGRRFLRDLVKKHTAEYHMTLYCSGPRRRRFFARGGFVIKWRDGDTRYMTTDRTPERFR